MEIRAASQDDLDAVIALTRSSRRQLAEWSAVYFNPREGADENHANFLRFMVGSDDHRTLVLVDDEQVIGFFTEVPQDQQLWIDDLCMAPGAEWRSAVQAITNRINHHWVTCVSPADTDRLRALDDAGLRQLSAYYALTIEPVQSFETAMATIADYRSAAPTHTFGGRAFSPRLPGALVIATEGGYVVGSPSASPPIYDPGGPTCVIDQVHGDNRDELLSRAIHCSAGRGDAQVVVVCDTADEELARIVLDFGFTKVVTLQGTEPPHV